MDSMPRVLLVYAAAALFSLAACCGYFFTGGDVARAAAHPAPQDAICLLSIL